MPATPAPIEDAPAFGTAQELVSGVLWSRLPLTGTLGHVNVYLLEMQGGWVLIDTGSNTEACREYLTLVLESVCSPRSPLRHVIVTHFHPDHVGLAGWLVSQGATLQMTKSCWLSTRLLRLETEADYLQASTSFLRRAGLNELEIAQLKRSTRRSFAQSVTPLSETYVRLQDGARLPIGARTWQVLTADGHASEHATFWSDDLLAILGDQVLPNVSTNLSIHPSEPEANPVAEWLFSCDKLAARAAPETLGLPGHNLPFHGIAKRCEQLVAVQLTVLQRLLDFLTRPRTALECLRVVYGRDLASHEFSLLLSETVGFLNHLCHTGQISRQLTGAALRYYRRATPSPHFTTRQSVAASDASSSHGNRKGKLD